MNCDDIIKKLEERGFTRGQIALGCGVKIRTVDNWASGIKPGLQSEKLLRQYAAERGVG